MTSLQRSAVSFRRQGSSGRIWGDQFILNQRGGENLQNQEHGGEHHGKNSNCPGDNIQIQKSSSSSSSSSPSSYFSEIRRGTNISSPTRSKPGCGLSSFFRRCIGSSAHA
ncbi:unnamed protein product [Eruca vesicaria subsp. sativa]|uniref:Uncharacterized protein n=1 Tax=Eruca vesicaria subsp. sativa TaxID=29727 RepID=A0ABC8JTM3_ERUVS|nr:unnamed protein product [Eruca vesicaria subsp. sativa]